MAGYSWTAPNQGGVFPSQANFRVAPADIGGLVAAIMRMRQVNAQNQQNQMNQLLSGIGQGISGAYGVYQNDQNASQIANYLQLQRQAQAAGVPGGQSQAMLEAEQGMNPQARLSVEQYMANQPGFMTDPVTGQTIYGSAARGWHSLSGNNYGQPTAHELGVQARDEARNLKSDIEDQTGGLVNIRDAANVTYGDYDPQTGQFVPNENGQYGVIGGIKTGQQQIPGPWYKFGYGGHQQPVMYAPQGTVFPREQAQQIQQDAQRYQDLIRTSGHFSQAGGFGLGGSPQMNASIRRIQADYHSGKIDRAEAARQLHDLGLNFTE